ncbi:glycine betaine ABC transporter substrate-binding protein [Telmatospirillum siberiense]|uniref:Taurine ABC transporter substrate-binding protein n=1 Tax=Telmatospirillum siberiense TaxID=382514 RepID=A0A2N3PMR2_9PROT|nr:glycine betaine ABC transporter substrate-binding protein [Telmatospirillum siberiense]PKU21682.1 taurine ABC transporter substrate-binding protein [Telmatospirillum siberiense]
MPIGKYVILAAGALAGLLALPPLSQAEEVPAVVRFGYLNGPRPWILGKADQSFDKALGTKVQWINFPNGPNELNALAAGEVDIGRIGSVPTVSALVRKVPIKVIAVSGVIATSERLIARKGIDSVKALEGHAVAYPPGSTAHYALLAAFKVHQVDVSKVRQVQLKPGDLLAAWKRGDIDAAYVWGPFSQQLEGENGHAILATKDLQPAGYFLFNDYVVRKEFAEKYPGLVVKFLKTFGDTVARYKADPDGSAAIIAKELDQDPAAAKDTLAGLIYPPLNEQRTTAWLGDGHDSGNAVITKSFADTARFLVEQGELRAADLPSDFAPFIDTSFLAKAVAAP